MNGTMISYANETIEFKDCPSCCFANHQFSLPCGIAFENENFTVSQDWELPIPGFFVIAPKKHVENLCELSDEEQAEMFAIMNKTIRILKENGVCNKFNFICEEKKNVHLHIWIMPRHEWMNQLVGNITKNIGAIFAHAKKFLRTDENYEYIKKVSDMVKKGFE